jgi:hypothetical protein
MIDKKEMERVKHSEQCEGAGVRISISALSSRGRTMSQIEDQNDDLDLISKR